MYNQSSLSTGTKWFFFLAIVILGGAFALGFNVKDAKWLNGEIASATANQMNVTTDIDRQKAELDLQVLRTQAEIQVAQMKQQAGYEAAKQQQELNDSAVAAIQQANFQADLYSTANFGIVVVVIAVGTALTIIGISAAIGLYKVLNAKAQAISPSQSETIGVYKRRPSAAAQKARQRERAERAKRASDNRINQLFPNSEPIWSAKGDESENLNPGNLPLAV